MQKTSKGEKRKKEERKEKQEGREREKKNISRRSIMKQGASKNAPKFVLSCCSSSF